MQANSNKVRLWSEIVFAIFIIGMSAFLLNSAFDLPTNSAFLPIAMLITLIILALTLIITLFFRQQNLTALSIGSPKKVIGGFVATTLYILAVQTFGFYTSTLIMIPTVAWIFGYRNLLRLTLATLIFVGAIYMIFSFLMGQQFPAEFFLI